jgi:mono/diheme cytochrome c family protein
MRNPFQTRGMTMKSALLFSLFAALSLPAQAAGDAKKGQTMHDAKCVACHAGMFGGDASRMYTRPDRKVKNMTQLAARVSACNANVGADWFPEDEAHVSAYLNSQFYKFK